MTSFTGTLNLVWLALKRDRIQLPIWVLALGALMAAFIAVYDANLPTEADLRASTEVLAGNPGTRMFGLASGYDLGSYTLLRSFTIVAVLVGLMSVLAVVRHTRQSEEARQAEMVGSAVVGRYSMLAAALIVVGLANLAVALLVGGVFLLNGLSAEGSFAAGAATGAVGLFFGGIAGVAAQVSPSSRGASGIAMGIVGAAVLLAAAGTVLGTVRPTLVDVDPAWPIWLSPIGWGQLMRPFSEANWWLLSVFVVAFAALAAIAFALIDRRDVGRGILPEGRGPANASPGLLSPLGLAWRLQRSVFFAWAVGIVAFGLVVGGIAESIEEMLEELEASELIERIGGTEQMLDAFFVSIITLLGTVIAAYTVQVLLRMRIEETDGPLESVLSAAVSRPRWMLSYAANAVAGTLVLLLLLGASIGLAAGLALGDLGTWLPDLTVAALTYAPATFVIAGLVLVLFSVLPRRAAGLSWAVFAIALIVGPYFGEVLELPQAVMNLSPFTHIPGMPVADFDAVPLVALLLVAAGLAAVGFTVFRRRDLALQ